MATSNVVPSDDARIQGSSGLLSLSKAAKICGIAPQSLRFKSNQGEVETVLLPSGHRRFTIKALKEFLGEDTKTADKVLLYARVSTNKQSRLYEDESQLTRQRDRLRKYAKEHYKGKEIIEFVESGSGVNFNRPKFTQLLEGILSGQYDNSILLLEFRDRVMRSNHEIFWLLCRFHNVQIVCIEQQDLSDEEQLTSDLMSIVFLFAIKSYGKRSSERLRKRPSPEVIERATFLLDSGLSCLSVTKQLQDEGYEASHWQIQRYVIRERNHLKKVIPKSISTGEEYFNLFAVDGDGNDRLPIGKLYDHYCKWCEKNGKVIMSRRRLILVFRRKYIAVHVDGGKIKGARIKGANIHETIKSRQTKTDSVDSMLAFIDQLRGRTVQLNEAMREYNALAEKLGVAPASQNQLVKTLLMMGGKRITKNRQILLTMPK